MARDKSKKKKKSKFRVFLYIQLVLIGLVLIGVAYYYLGGYGERVAQLKNEAVQIARNTTDGSFRAIQTSVVYDNKGEEISNLIGEKDVYYLSYDQIPVFVKKAFVVSEDKQFYSHDGIDFRAIFRALVAFFQNGGEVSEGASTITMQLARNMFLTYEKNWERKAEEIFIAIELEKLYSKEKILEYYINNIYFANGHYGIGAACKGYFSKEISELTLSEMIFLCAIPNNPTLYDPVTNMDNTLARRDRILKLMYEEGIINKEQYNEAVSQKIVLNINRNEKNNYVETYIYHCATESLMSASGFKFQYYFTSTGEELEYDKRYAESYAECQQKLYTGGYRIYTSMDLAKQAKLQNELDTQLADYQSTNEEGVYQLQGAACCINNLTGYVEAIVGGRSQNLPGYTLNRAYQSYRQPGSTIKPILVYTPAFERGYTPDTIVEDQPIEDGPENADKDYAGTISIRGAVSHSKNVPAWNLLNEITPIQAFKYLFNMEFTHLCENDYNLNAALGGLTYGVSAVEMAAAFETLANDGKFSSASCIIKITDANGKLIWGKDNYTTQVYQTNAARMMTDVLETVMESGTGRGYALDNMPCAGKTGTTNDNKDIWFVGYTHYYTVSAWIGYDMPQTIPGTSTTAPITIWKNFMEDIHTGLEPVEFQDTLYNNKDKDNKDD